MDTAQRFKLNFDVDRAPETTRIKELHEHILKLEEAAQKKTNSKIGKSSSNTPEHTNNGKKTNLVEEDDEEPDAAPLLCKRKKSIPAKRLMTLPSSNRRIHSIHKAHQPSDATKGNQTGSSTSTLDTQTRSVPESASSSGGIVPSLDEDDHLTIKKLKTQHVQSLSPHILTPFYSFISPNSNN